MKILFLTNVPSPYRVAFFNELGKHCELTVLFEKRLRMNEMNHGSTINLRTFPAFF